MNAPNDRMLRRMAAIVLLLLAGCTTTKRQPYLHRVRTMMPTLAFTISPPTEFRASRIWQAPFVNIEIEGCNGDIEDCTQMVWWIRVDNIPTNAWVCLRASCEPDTNGMDSADLIPPGSTNSWEFAWDRLDCPPVIYEINHEDGTVSIITNLSDRAFFVGRKFEP